MRRLCCLAPSGLPRLSAAEVIHRFRQIAAELSDQSPSSIAHRAEAVPWELRGTKEFNELRHLVSERTSLTHALGLATWPCLALFSSLGFRS